MSADSNDNNEFEEIQVARNIAHRADQAVAELIDRKGWRTTWYERLLEPFAELRHKPEMYLVWFVILLALAPRLGVVGTLLAIWAVANIILAMKVIDVLLYRMLIRRERRREQL